jgi:uncharacterized membrane protein YjjB (DUF3815 family)
MIIAAIIAVMVNICCILSCCTYLSYYFCLHNSPEPVIIAFFLVTLIIPAKGLNLLRMT